MPAPIACRGAARHGTGAPHRVLADRRAGLRRSSCVPRSSAGAPRFAAAAGAFGREPAPKRKPTRYRIARAPPERVDALLRAAHRAVMALIRLGRGDRVSAPASSLRRSPTMACFARIALVRGHGRRHCGRWAVVTGMRLDIEFQAGTRAIADNRRDGRREPIAAPARPQAHKRGSAARGQEACLGPEAIAGRVAIAT